MKQEFSRAVTTGIHYALDDDLNEREVEEITPEQREQFEDFHAKLAELAKEFKALQMLGN